jgi:uncharacterized protein YPO0396
MIAKYGAMLAALALLAPLGAVQLDAQVPATQQAQQQQLQRMQEQVQRLTETTQRMTRIQDQAREMEQLMLRDMQQLRQQEGLQLQDQERLRQQENVRNMAHALAGAAGEMNQAVLGLREMAQNSGQKLDRDMEQQMDRLRQHLQETCDQMEAGLRVIEQLRDRLNRS